MTWRRARNRRSSGFTLIEIVAALVLLALLATVLFGIVGNAERSLNAATAAQERTEQILRLNQFLRDHLGGMLPLRWRRELGQPLRFEGRSESMTFLAPVLSHIAEGGVMWWRLEVDAGERDRPRLVIRRLPQNPEVAEIPDFREAETIVLAEPVGELVLRYFDPGPNPVEEPEAGRWVTSWEEPGRSPTAIEVTLRDPQDATILATVVQLHLSPSLGCNFDFQRGRCVIPGVAP
ncbi:MAG: prepilin-type N-terminal cleavage/methylation domain-containing protein [Casimicrobiaceae bacterium]